MFGHVALEQVVHFSVAASANGRGCLLGIHDLGRLVPRVAGHAVLCGELDFRAMRLMACAALRDISVFFGVAVSTGDIRGMFAGIILYFIVLFGMTLRTRGFSRHGNLQRLMGVGVAVEARGQDFAFPMKWASACAQVARGTLRHDLIIVFLARIVHMVFGMTLYTVDLVSSPVRFYGLKD